MEKDRVSQDSILNDSYLDKAELVLDSSDGDTKDAHRDKVHGLLLSRAGDPQLEGREATGEGLRAMAQHVGTASRHRERVAIESVDVW